MKKILILATILFVAMTGRAQWFDFSNNSERAGIGFHLGQMGMHTDYTDFGGGFSVNVLGVYFDFSKAGPEHKFDNHVTNTLYNDSVAWSINLGYQIPVLPWLRLVPVVGYCQTNAGLTDATTVNVDVDSDHNASIYHDYDVTEGTRQHYFNFGLGLSVSPIKWIDLYFFGTNHSMYGGISLNLGAFSSNDFFVD